MGLISPGKVRTRPKDRKYVQKPNWRAVFVTQPIPCDKCGVWVKNHIAWKRDVAHKYAGLYRCSDCPPEKADYK